MKSFTSRVKQSFTHPTAPPGMAPPAGVSLVDVSEKLVAKVCRDRDPDDPIDWNEVARVVDLIRYIGPSISLVLKALKHQWRTRKASVQVTVLAVLDFCMTNVKRSFSARFAGAELWRDIKDATKFKNMVKPSVHTLLLTYTQAWAVNPGAVASFHEFYEKLKTRGYKFPSPEAYEQLRPLRYIPLKQRTDDSVKVAMLDKAEAAIEDDDTTSVQGDTALDAIIPEEEGDVFDSIVVKRSGASGDLINLLDLDWDPEPAPQAGTTPVDPFAASDKVNQAPEAAVPAGNPFGSNAFQEEATQQGHAVSTRQASNNPFAEDAPVGQAVPSTGISTVPLAHGGGPIPAGLFGVMPVVPGAAPGAAVQPGVAQGYAMGESPAAGGYWQQPGALGGGAGNVNEVLATIPPPPGSAQAKQPQDPLANLLS